MSLPPSPGGGFIPGAQQQQQLKRRKCAEVCFELLALEALRNFSAQSTGPTAAAAMEAVGFRVGRQLAERCVPPAGRGVQPSVVCGCQPA